MSGIHVPVLSLPAATTLDGSEAMPVVQAGVTKRSKAPATGTTDGQTLLWDQATQRWVAGNIPVDGGLFVSVSFEEATTPLEPAFLIVTPLPTYLDL